MMLKLKTFKKCVKCGVGRACFSPKGTPSLRCTQCKDECDVNTDPKLCRYELGECCHYPVWGYPGSSPTHCSQHKKKNMARRKNLCHRNGCNNPGYYGIKGKLQFCKEHKTDEMVHYSTYMRRLKTIVKMKKKKKRPQKKKRMINTKKPERNLLKTPSSLGMTIFQLKRSNPMMKIEQQQQPPPQPKTVNRRRSPRLLIVSKEQPPTMTPIVLIINDNKEEASAPKKIERRRQQRKKEKNPIVEKEEEQKEHAPFIEFKETIVIAQVVLPSNSSTNDMLYSQKFKRQKETQQNTTTIATSV